MTQDMLPFQYEVEEDRAWMTGLGGLPVYLELMHRMGFKELIGENLNRRSQGYTDAQVITALMFLNLAGGESVEDVRVLEADGGILQITAEGRRLQENPEAKERR